MQHLAKAEEIKPDAPEVWDQFFQYYARQKQWDKLQPYLDKLVPPTRTAPAGCSISSAWRWPRTRLTGRSKLPAS